MKNYGTFDYIVAGAGTAGCVLANRLSQDPEVSVLLLEAGGKDDWIWIHIPVGYLYSIGNPRTDWCYKTEPEAGLNGRSIPYARGRVLGGSSSINAMIYMRGQSRDYDQWAELTGDASWAWKEVLPLFKGSEDYWRGADEMHGAGGEWRAEPQRLRWDILDRFSEAATQAGIAATDDFNRGDNAGVGRSEVNQRRGVRWNTSKAFLRPVLGRPNLKVQTGAVIDRVSFAGKRATGIEFELGGEKLFAASRIETVLAAGAIGSPAILQRSGIGAASLLAEHGIPVVHEAPGVGENLQDHLQVRTIFKVSGIKSLNQVTHSWLGKAKMAIQYALFRSGPLSMAPCQVGIFAKSDPSQATPDLEYHMQALSLDRFGAPLHRFPAFTAAVCNLHPSSRGHVAIGSREPQAAPRIAPHYLSTEADRRVAAASFRLTRRIASMPALAPYRPEETLPGPHCQSDEELVRAAGDIGMTVHHPVGTCRMGRPEDGSAVVDSRLRVFGIAGLRVVDASIMPTITSANTNTPTLMIAEKGARMIREDRKAGGA